MSLLGLVCFLHCIVRDSLAKTRKKAANTRLLMSLDTYTDNDPPAAATQAGDSNRPEAIAVNAFDRSRRPETLALQVDYKDE